MNNDKYLSITAITRYLKHKLDSDEHLKCVFLRGEISNLLKHVYDIERLVGKISYGNSNARDLISFVIREM